MATVHLMLQVALKRSLIGQLVKFFLLVG